MDASRGARAAVGVRIQKESITGDQQGNQGVVTQRRLAMQGMSRQGMQQAGQASLHTRCRHQAAAN